LKLYYQILKFTWPVILISANDCWKQQQKYHYEINLVMSIHICLIIHFTESKQVTQTIFLKILEEFSTFTELFLNCSQILPKNSRMTLQYLTLRYCAGVLHTLANVFLQLPKYGAYLLSARFSSLLL
jgi:hypothetical protein